MNTMASSAPGYAAVSMLLLSLCPYEAAGAPSEIRTKWAGLASLVGGRRVVIVADGATLDGKVLAVTDRGLEMEGARTVPRASVANLRLIQHRKAGRIFGMLAGAVGGLFAGGALADEPDQLGRAINGAIIGMIGGAVGGYFLGRVADRKTTVVVVVPD